MNLLFHNSCSTYIIYTVNHIGPLLSKATHYSWRVIKLQCMALGVLTLRLVITVAQEVLHFINACSANRLSISIIPYRTPYHHMIITRLSSITMVIAVTMLPSPTLNSLFPAALGTHTPQ